MTADSEEPRYKLLSGLASIFSSEEYSDLQITCGTDMYHVHKAIICCQSGFFKLACSEKYKEGKEGVVPLAASTETKGWDCDGNHPEAVKSMIHYFYHLDYLQPSNATPSVEVKAGYIRCSDCNGVTWNDAEAGTAQTYFYCDNCAGYTMPTSKDAEVRLATPTPRIEPLSHDARMYAMASKYDIPGLKVLARSKFSARTTKLISNTDLAEAIDIVYNSTVETDWGLRKIVVDLLDKKGKTVCKHPDVEAAIKSITSLAYALWEKRL